MTTTSSKQSPRPLGKLKNIGKKLESRLKEAGINSEKELRKVKPAGAHNKIQSLYPNETLPVCYYLYSFEGALRDLHWDAIGERRKTQLRKEIGKD